MGENEARSTLVKPPPLDPEKSAMENVLELTALTPIGPNVFTNTRPLWHPPGARGIYGGAVIAQCLAAAQLTVPSTFVVHSMHCYFVLAGDSAIPVLYHVEHVRTGRSFMTRTVQARQKGQCIFTTTLSFAREGSGGKKTLRHATPLPAGIVAPRSSMKPAGGPAGRSGRAAGSPFESRAIEMMNGEGRLPHEKRTRQWIRAKGRISKEGGHQAHLSALAYMSDSYFIGTVSRIHNMWRFGDPSNRSEGKGKGKGTRRSRAAAEEIAGDVKDDADGKGQDADDECDDGDDDEGEDDEDDETVARAHRERDLQVLRSNVTEVDGRPVMGMMVSLDHSIYFHEPTRVRADEWMFTEMESPWAGDGRGVVQQKMFASDGTLVATCFQEGVVRVRQEPEGEGTRAKL